MKGQAGQSKRSTLRKIAFITLGTIGLLLLIEIGLRIGGFCHRPTPFLQFNFLQSEPIYRADPETMWAVRQKATLTFDEALMHVPAELQNYYNRLADSGFYLDMRNSNLHSNNFGMHSSNDCGARKAANTIRVLCIGGSTTWGISTNWNWTALLERKLRSALPREIGAEVLNASVPAHSSLQIMERFEHHLTPIEADVVIFMSAWNDAARGFGSDAETLSRWRAANEEVAAWHSLRIMQLARRVRCLLFPPSADCLNGYRRAGPRVTIDQYKENVRTIAGLARRRKMKLVICTEASALPILDEKAARHFNETGGHTVEVQNAYNDAARAMAKELGVPLADPAAAMPKEKLRDFYFEPEFEPIHPIVTGEQFIADAVFETLDHAGYLAPAAWGPVNHRPDRSGRINDVPGRTAASGRER